MTYILTGVTALIAGFWIYLLTKTGRQIKKESFAIRGILKHYNNGKLDNAAAKTIKLWLFVFGFLFIVLFLWVILLTWKTDYNFLIAVYPFVWHYVFFRYFLWEKEDLVDHHEKKTH